MLNIKICNFRSDFIGLLRDSTSNLKRLLSDHRVAFHRHECDCGDGLSWSSCHCWNWDHHHWEERNGTSAPHRRRGIWGDRTRVCLQPILQLVLQWWPDQESLPKWLTSNLIIPWEFWQHWPQLRRSTRRTCLRSSFEQRHMILLTQILLWSHPNHAHTVFLMSHESSGISAWKASHMQSQLLPILLQQSPLS